MFLLQPIAVCRKWGKRYRIRKGGRISKGIFVGDFLTLLSSLIFLHNVHNCPTKLDHTPEYSSQVLIIHGLGKNPDYAGGGVKYIT
jgi:hypothetical protein